QTFSASQVSQLVIDASDGDDTIAVGSTVTARAWIYAGGGNDRVTAGGGPSTIYGAGGDDTITGGSGAHVIYGGLGTNSITGQAGDQVTQGTAYQTASLSTIEQQILDLTNQQRAANGLAPLTMSGQLTAAAHLQSNNMAALAPVIGADPAMSHE